MLFCTITISSKAQNKYLLLEYIKMKPGITDTSSVMHYIHNRIDEQEKKFKSILWSSLWQVANPARVKNQYDYVITTEFKNFTDWLSEYKNKDSKGVFYSITKGRLDSASIHKSDSFDIVYTPIFEVLADAGNLKKQPKLLLIKYVKATPGKEVSYEGLEIDDWVPIHQDLIKKQFESAFSFSGLYFPQEGSDYNYITFTYFADDAMFDKQNDVDYDPYMRSNQSAFINAGNLNKEIFSEMLVQVAFLKSEE